jgi:uncharacterized delta-60 repeat protein
MKSILLLSPLLFLSLRVFSQAGTLDSTFDGDGIVIDKNMSGEPTDVAIQGDNKILVCGYDNDLAIFCIARYLPGGSLDNSFAIDGKATVDFSSTDGDFATAIAVQSDGKIIAVGNGYESSGDQTITEVVRLNNDGTIDLSFGNNGKIEEDLFPLYVNEYYFELLIQPDSHLVVCGYKEMFGIIIDGIIIRATPSGELDNSFSGDGIFIYDSGYNDEFLDIAIQPDGKIIAAGLQDLNGTKCLLLRLNMNGTIDSSFGTNGVVTFDGNSGGFGIFSSVELMPDGNIIAAGVSYVSDDFLIMRFSQDGIVDSTFGTNGTVTIDFNNESNSCQSINRQADGKLIVSGSSQGFSNDTHFSIARLNTDGSIDSSFGIDGKITTDLLEKEYLFESALQADGKLIVTGWTSDNLPNTSYAIVRYLSDIYTGGMETSSDVISHSLIYANPCLDHTTLTYALYHPTDITLQLTDLTGKITRTFFSEHRSEGKHKEELNMEGIAAGVYFLRLTTGEKRVSFKIIKQ